MRQFIFITFVFGDAFAPIAAHVFEVGYGSPAALTVFDTVGQEVHADTAGFNMIVGNTIAGFISVSPVDFTDKHTRYFITPSGLGSGLCGSGLVARHVML